MSVGYLTSTTAGASELQSGLVSPAQLEQQLEEHFKRAQANALSDITVRAGSSGDSDGDGVPDTIDIDDDNDTIPDSVEGTGDVDGDGIVDCLDIDSDNDGITDLVEAVSAAILARIDRDQNGLLDGNITVGENGLVDIVETDPESGSTTAGTQDTDGDGVRDQHDLDADNDGIPDVVEAGSTDSDADGLYDFFLDLNGDGFADRLVSLPILLRDSDNDNIADFRDLDSDGDGLSDRLEVSGTDADSDGRVDNFVDLNADGLTDDYSSDTAGLTDTDGDGTPDFRDLDSDGDGVSDADEGFVNTTAAGPIVSTTPFDPSGITIAGPEEPIMLQTGENGSVFGCSVSAQNPSRNKVDPMLPLLFLLSLVALARGRVSLLVQSFMKSGRKKPYAMIALTAFLATGCATPSGLNTADSFESYVGIGAGASFLNVNTTGLNLEQDDDFSPAAQVTAGLSLQGPFWLEFRGADLGEATFTNGQAVGYQVADISALYQKRFNRFSTFARLGAGALFNDGDIETDQLNKTHLLVGAGAELALSRQFSLRAEWQGHDLDVMHSQLSVLYRFGNKRSSGIVLAREKAAPAPVEQVAGSDSDIVESTSISGLEVTQIEPIASQRPNPAPETDREAQASAELAPVPRPRPVAPVPPTPAPVPPAPAPAPQVSEPPAPEQQIALATPPAEAPTRLRPLVTVPVEPPPEPPKPVVQTIDPATLDGDEDGINDANDICAGTDSGVSVFKNGCAIFGKSVAGLKFDPDTDRLTPSAVAVLNTVADELIEESDIRVTVAAHASASSDANAAMFLTRRRTIAIIRYLSNRGIDATRLRPEAYGDTEPLENAVEPSDNDRVVFTLR